MSPRSGDDVFLLRGGERWRDPWSAYRRLRDDSPVHRVDHPMYGEFWVLSRFDDVFDAVRDTTTFSSAQGLTPDAAAMAMFEDRARPCASGLDTLPVACNDDPSHAGGSRWSLYLMTPRSTTGTAMGTHR